ncbi:hypothetical protein BpHYR1_010646 [Brachionus plicatilis]|uniref:Uncharacterized protein n=1 Tax=Brachionus plicatilis TaxID=10195 RepID=A0A3M7PAR9_BRAPC|nr:hypothetical protein BpHYR1_010646 [Brachionus plicatilis]
MPISQNNPEVFSICKSIVAIIGLTAIFITSIYNSSGTSSLARSGNTVNKKLATTEFTTLPHNHGNR